MNDSLPRPELWRISCADAHAPSGAGRHDIASWHWGRADAPHLVVCAHGLTRNGRDFDLLARSLIERAGGRLRVLCPDVAGRGDSDWLTDPDGYQLPYYVADMLALLTEAQGRGPIERLSWVGTSMGGLIGLVLAGQPGLPLPKSIDRLLLNDVGPVVEWQALQRIAAHVGLPMHFDSVEHAATALWSVSPTFGQHTPAQWQALTTPMLKAAPQGGWQLRYDPAIAQPLKRLTAEQVAQGEAALWRLYDAVEAETLLTRGAESDLLSNATARAMTERGPRARLVEFEGVGHAPTFVVREQLEVAVEFVLE